MAKDLKLAMLIDFYGGLLTEKQFEALDMYYNQDLSLAEIADEMNISRQGAMSFLRQGEKHLRTFENKLGLAERFERINEKISSMRSVADKLPKSAEREALKALIEEVGSII